MNYYNPIEFLKPLVYENIQQDKYLIGDNGSIYDIKTQKFKQLKPHKTTGYVLGQFKTEDDEEKTIRIHRLVASHFVEGYSEEDGTIQVDHIDFNKSNNDYTNLEWVTISENNRRRYLNPDNNKFVNPPIYYGEDHPSCKHDINIIKRICEELESGKSIIETLYSFGYTAQSQNKILYNLIYDIKHKRSWTETSKNYNF